MLSSDQCDAVQGNAMRLLYLEFRDLGDHNSLSVGFSSEVSCARGICRGRRDKSGFQGGSYLL